MTRFARRPMATRETLGSRSWVIDAECRETGNPDLFFPIAEQEEPTARAKRVCFRCPVQSDCLAWALANGMSRGIWGGLTEQERKALSETELRRLIGKAGQ